jgi:tRNA nucleotidyltransferase (CCA-adding enzyme)
MHVILTHEQADFDAIAAALGAYLLNEQAFAVLPRRANRNVRAFLTLYGAELPFVEPRDLPQGSIDQVTLVDTQSFVTLKGMGHKTRVQVVDHHQLRPELPEDWSVRIDRTGACTTLFVEALQERRETLDGLQASLLLLGIYEDTGSLTYASTTARDAHAAAYLLEQGANLGVVGNYLNPPLSAEQRSLYDRLLTAAETYHIGGQNVVLAYASAEDLTEEISSIAHKLRDLLDPDALILLVSISDGVRMVARSTTDQIDVSALAAHFGGGGHERASAALIKSADGARADAAALYREMVEILPRFVRPSVTVGSIMSRQPHLLAADTTAKDAAQLMTRYGYEGYPVVQGGKVIGLLTRRAVDRALSHKLNLPAASLMDAGEVTVQPDDSVEHLQRVMTSTGWGQVPVIDPASGSVTGIVTRTDLLKSLSSSMSMLPGKQNLASRLEALLPAGRLAFLKLIADRAREQRQAVYIVGGFVRDLILERPSFDFDIVVEGDAISLARSLTASFGGRMTSHSRFGTAKWQIAEIRPQLVCGDDFPPGTAPEELPESLDLISARTEFYDYPTALPTVERSSIKLDLHRRDFTINTMALRLDGRHYGELYDYWGGLSDLHQGLVRVLHSLSFVDDPTRLLRAVRFEQRFKFRIETRTHELMEGARPLLRQVSGDRLRHELNLILCEDQAPAMFARMQELELLSAIHPELTWDDRLTAILQDALNAEIDSNWDLPGHLGSLEIQQALGYLVWLANLPLEHQRGVSERLRFPRSLQAALEETHTLARELPGLRGASPSSIVTRLDGVPMLVLYAVYKMQPSLEVQHMLESYARLLRHVRPYTTGSELREMGVAPGPAYRAILEDLRSAWLDGTITSKDEERSLLQELLQTHP